MRARPLPRQGRGLWFGDSETLSQECSHPCSQNIQGCSRSSTRLRSGWIGCSVALGRCKRKGERGSMREKGIDGRHRRGGELPLDDQSGTTPFVNTSAVPSTDPVKLPPRGLLARNDFRVARDLGVVERMLPSQVRATIFTVGLPRPRCTEDTGSGC
jgi:hypothetical protein